MNGVRDRRAQESKRVKSGHSVRKDLRGEGGAKEKGCGGLNCELLAFFPLSPS